MKVFLILAHIFGPSLALPLVAQRLLSASNSNEVLLGLVNANIPQAGAINVLLPGMYKPQLQQKIAGLPQLPFGARTGLAAQLPNQVSLPNVGTQSVLLDPTAQNQQQPNQVMSYVVSYGIPQKQGQVPVFSMYPAQQQPAPTLPKQIGNHPPMEQTFGCLVPQMNGEIVMASGGLQLPTKSPDAITFDEGPTTAPNNMEYMEKKDTPYAMKSP
ncbi:odontogenic ameloblast-associated protein [Hyperolius riggenbachi]|uniref:odontogenic ameloblast-associated protein n=1 Tax=Hyperolius riggenbachi TaxID=752182 RepID=UPI0035A28A19